MHVELQVPVACRRLKHGRLPGLSARAATLGFGAMLLWGAAARADDGLPRDITELRTVAEKGDPVAQFCLGSRYYSGRHGEAAREQVVAREARAHFDDFAAGAEVVDIRLKQNVGGSGHLDFLLSRWW